VKEGNEVIGNRVRVKVAKNKLAPPFRETEFDILFQEGISREADVLDLAANLGIVTKSGAWYSYGETRLGQGRDNARKFLKERKDILEEIEGKIRSIRSLPSTFTIIGSETAEVIEAE
jgi:recombination protein RecA